MTLWPNAQKLVTTYIPDIELEEIVLRNFSFPIIDKNDNVLVDVPLGDDVRTSCWAGIHGLLLMACEKEVEGHGSLTVQWGHQVHGIVERSDHLVVTYKGNGSIEEQMTADLVVAADGARSHIRKLVLPDVNTEYAGYLAWRSQISELEIPEELRFVLEGKVPQCMFDGSYVVVYTSPNEIGSMRKGERVIEWCWYDPCDASTAAFADYMTDTEGVRHEVTVPANQLRTEVWEAQLERRDAMLSPRWKKIFHQSKKMPLLTAIHGFDNTKASFYGGKLLLAGEAFIQVRPNMGASCDIAALSAMTLSQVLDGSLTVHQWEKKVAAHGMEKAIGSRATAVFGMTGKWPDSYTAESAAQFSQEFVQEHATA
ncbi:hypothetical protein ACET3X_000226 [Alternaria dauci]|uniref:FAD-binding domain-containing protein n=1 Tax=Alternaria dauci TaxID=48095 RepID=A0ABR3UU73_9PLEO